MIEEIELKKVSVYKTKINSHLFETIFSYIEQNKKNFLARSWDCNIKTSYDVYKNILHDIEEFKYVRKSIYEQIENLYLSNYKKSIPFYIDESWINVLQENGYQEFHQHLGSTGSGVLYLSNYNSAIEFAIFPENTRKKIIPEKGDLLLFDSSTFHRVVDSEKERISLAFNFKSHTNQGGT
jgi:hypothetical protein